MYKFLYVRIYILFVLYIRVMYIFFCIVFFSVGLFFLFEVFVGFLFFYLFCLLVRFWCFYIFYIFLFRCLIVGGGEVVVVVGRWMSQVGGYRGRGVMFREDGVLGVISFVVGWCGQCEVVFGCCFILFSLVLLCIRWREGQDRGVFSSRFRVCFLSMLMQSFGLVLGVWFFWEDFFFS